MANSIIDSLPIPSSEDDRVILECPETFRIYKGGRAERFNQFPIVSASEDDDDDCRSKDVQTALEKKVFARLFLPKTVAVGEKLPVLFYMHGGAFTVGSAFNSVYHNYVRSLAIEAKVLAISIEYRLAPEKPVAVCFEDCWETMRWFESHNVPGRKGPEPWINDHADFSRVYLAGDSAGGTLAQNMAMRAGVGGRDGIGEGVKIVGVILVHSFFGCKPDDEYLWKCLCSDEESVTGLEDPRLNPMGHPDLLRKLKCNKILILTAEKDFVKDRSWLYYEAVKKSGWEGELEIEDTKGEDHDFHLKNPDSENALLLMKKVISFLKN